VDRTTAALLPKIVSIALLLGLFISMGVCVASIQASDLKKTDSQLIELEYWQTVKDSKDPKMYKAYLDAYPEGAFTSLANILYEKHKTPEDPPVGSMPEYRVALFPWEFKEDAVHLSSIVVGQSSAAIANWPGMVLTASHYKNDKGHTVVWLENDEFYKSQKEKIWRNSAPDFDNIIRIGRELNIDAVLIGKIRARNKWSDQYVLKHIKTWMIDTNTGKIIRESNKSDMTVPREELIKIIDRTVANFWKEVISKER